MAGIIFKAIVHLIGAVDHYFIINKDWSIIKRDYEDLNDEIK